MVDSIGCVGNKDTVAAEDVNTVVHLSRGLV